MPPAAPVDPSAVAANLADARARIARAGGAQRTRVVAVTKGFGVDAIRAAIAAGADGIGENYAQEWLAKRDALGENPAVPVHFIGQLQRNKVRALASSVTLWHTVDRAALAREIAVRAPGASVLLQVNVANDPGQGGCAPGEVESLLASARAAGLDVRGLMAIGAHDDPAHAAAGFAELASLAAKFSLIELSMGMSDDYEAAVAAGSTMVRLGRSLFGARPRHTQIDT